MQCFAFQSGTVADTCNSIKINYFALYVSVNLHHQTFKYIKYHRSTGSLNIACQNSNNAPKSSGVGVYPFEQETMGVHQGWSNGPGGTLYVCRLDPWGHLVKINLAIWGRIRRSLTTVRSPDLYSAFISSRAVSFISPAKKL